VELFRGEKIGFLFQYKIDEMKFRYYLDTAVKIARGELPEICCLVREVKASAGWSVSGMCCCVSL
jgi:hypothetical protein